MKKIILIALLVTIIGNKIYAQAMNCNSICVLNITIDTVGANSLNVTIYNGSSVFVNYPSVMVVNSVGDTVGNINNLYFLFGQMAMDTVVHNIPTSLDSLILPFTGTVYFTDNSSHQVCMFSYPMVCTVGINESIEEDNTLSIVPNPATDKLVIQNLKTQPEEIKITNLLGECLFADYSPTINSGKAVVDISGFNNGIYFVEIKTESGVINKKIIKQ